VITLTTVQDFAAVVARAIEYEGEWPVVSGIRGTTVSVGELVALGEKLRGTYTVPSIYALGNGDQVLIQIISGPFKIERVKASDFEAGTWETSWIPRVDHPSIPPEQVDFFSKLGVAGISLAISAGAFAVSDEWNRLLPDYEFTALEPFLRGVWEGKP
jgi:hypothetical protein